MSNTHESDAEIDERLDRIEIPAEALKAGGLSADKFGSIQVGSDGSKVTVELPGNWSVTNMHQRGDNTYIVLERD